MDTTISIDHPLVASYLRDGKKYKFRYYEVPNFDKLDQSKIQQIYGVCFYQDKLVVVRNGKRNTWGLVGGHVEEGETVEQTLRREIKEESNMDIIRWRPIGVQEVTDEDGNVFYQLRAVCKVKPLGDFEEDPVGTISEMKLIEPKNYTEYFDWGEIGEKIMSRSIQLKPRL
jgi:8-oxo-dGTP diphosphatase